MLLFILFVFFILFFVNSFINLRVASIRLINLGFSFFIFFCSLLFLSFFNKAYSGFHWHLVFGSAFWALDSLSIFFLILSSFLILICVLLSWSVVYRIREYLGLLAFLHFLLYCVFSTLNLFLFYIFFEIVLVPMFLMIGIWGSRARKIGASYRFFFFTVLSSILMLVGIIHMYFHYGSCDIRIWLMNDLTKEYQIVFWFIFFLAFAVKIPLFPIHGWLPEAHVEAPTGGSILLAGILLKLGCYAILRFLFPLFPYASHFFSPLIFSICLLGLLFCGCSLLVSFDLKKVIAYSSIVHMSFAIMGIFSFNLEGIIGGIFLMLSHGLVSGALFFCVGILYERYNLRLIFSFGGLIQLMPIFGSFFFFLLLANIGFPGTSAFVGEFMIMCGLFAVQPSICILSLICVSLSTVRMFWLGTKILFGPIRGLVSVYSDLTFREFNILCAFCFFIVWFGLFPNSIIDIFFNFFFYLTYYILK